MFNAKDDSPSYGQGLAPGPGQSSHNYISHILEVLEFHLLVQQYTHSGHEIKRVRSLTYYFFCKLLQLNFRGRLGIIPVNSQFPARSIPSEDRTSSAESIVFLSTNQNIGLIQSP